MLLTLLLRLLATLLHAALMFGLAPLLTGVVSTLRAWALGRRGPAFVQPYRDLYKLLRKATLAPDTASQLFSAWSSRPSSGWTTRETLMFGRMPTASPRFSFSTLA